MRVLYASSEAHPLIKTGGLGDVAGALPLALQNQGADVRLILPAYADLLARTEGFTEVATLPDLVPGTPVTLLSGALPGTRLPVLLVAAPGFSDRAGNPYSGPDGHDWPDNAERFALFSRAIAAVAMDRAGLHWQAELVHCNDWQTGLAPALLSLEAEPPVTLFTIHNLAYQGLFDHATFVGLDLPAEWWSMHALEFHGQLSFIKGGLSFADRLTTVSPTYAREIQTPAFGCGLDALLRHRADDLVGILNGADYSEWDPRTDRYIAHHYDPESPAGKTADKRVLQRRFSLLQEIDIPLLGHVGRLVDQKGIDLILALIPALMRRRVQLAVLGSGRAEFEQQLKAAQARYPGQVGVYVGYDEALAHEIEAGADVFLMPSRFEPCGLNQIYSLRYGTVPIVHRTGGLADTVVDATPHTLRTGTATGFQFEPLHPGAFLAAVDRALALYRERSRWRALMRTGMRQDFSWERSATRYLALYEETLRSRRSASLPA